MLNWKGDSVAGNVQRAARMGIDETLGACVKRAKDDAPVRTTAYHGSIQMRPAVMEKGSITGYWGSFRILYAIFIELGTKAHIIRPKNKKALFWKGASHPVKEVKHPGTKPNPVLTRAAEEEYPKLAGRIRKYL